MGCELGRVTDEEIQRVQELKEQEIGQYRVVIDSAKQTMVGFLIGQPEGIGISGLYEMMEESGFDENISRSAFLELSYSIDLRRDRTVVLIDPESQR